MVKRVLDIFLRAAVTGITIGIGCTVFLMCENTYLGAFLFGMGLFIILSFGFYLYTGKVGYIIGNKPSYILEVLLIWFGNLIGTLISGTLISLTRDGERVSQAAQQLCAVKFSDSLLSIFILAFFCGILMFVAADGYRRIKNPLGQMLTIFLPVMVFILSGFEHSIADMFYFTVSGSWSANAAIYILILTLGNAAGGFMIPLFRLGFAEEKPQAGK